MNTFGDEPIPVKDQSWTVPGLGMQFVYVAPGNFQMGSVDGKNDERPVHAVNISKGYWVGKYEVTQTEYEEINGKNPSFFKKTNRPVEQVSWDNAVCFCQKLTQRERSAGRLPPNHEYCLPTESQWEFAARGGVASKGYKYSGGENLDSLAWYESNSSRATHEVGTKSPNELGIYDMSGNVWEWCQDDWHGNYVDAPSDGSRWGDGTGSNRVFRGGSWDHGANYCRVASRDINSPDHGGHDLGFRVVLTSSSK